MNQACRGQEACIEKGSAEKWDTDENQFWHSNHTVRL